VTRLQKVVVRTNGKGQPYAETVAAPSPTLSGPSLVSDTQPVPCTSASGGGELANGTGTVYPRGFFPRVHAGTGTGHIICTC
jgi:hypothetical protein